MIATKKPTKDFINLTDIDYDTYRIIIELAMKIKSEYKAKKINQTLQNKTLAMVFDKSSTRTRVSFEAGMTQLGGHSLFLSNRDTQLGRNESIYDSAKVISSMVDCVMLRISSHEDISEFAKHSSVPVINALSDESHPCQLLADLLTYEEHRGNIRGKTVSWIGDGNNMCHTYMQAAKLCGFTLNIASPKGYGPNAKFICEYMDVVNYFDTALQACQNSDLVVTDVWASMGQEDQQTQKAIDFTDYQVNQSLMAVAKPNALFMHCLPVYRGKEVSADVIDGKQSVIFDEAENRLHAQKALLLHLMLQK